MGPISGHRDGNTRSSGWDTSVDELVGLFRSALLALIPVLEAARIPWRKGEAYDQWDEITDVLYARFVCEPLAWALGLEDDLDLASYDRVRDNWRGASFLAVQHPDIPPGSTAAFLGFASGARPLDTADVSILDEDLHGRQTLSLGLHDTRFVLIWLRDQQLSTISAVAVPD